MRGYDACHEGADAATLAALRARCAAIVLANLGIAADPAVAAALLLDSIALRAYADVAPLMAGPADAGVGVAVVSKPHAGTFRVALAQLGVAPGRALRVGDTEETDGAGARATGVDVRIVDRGGCAPGADTITALTDVLDLL